MTKKQRQELMRLEKAIIKTARYVEGHGLVKPMSSWDGERRISPVQKAVPDIILFDGENFWTCEQLKFEQFL